MQQAGILSRALPQLFAAAGKSRTEPPGACPETRDTSWTYGSHSPFLKRKTSFQIQGGNRAIFKIAAIGIIVAVLNQLLIRSGREDQAMMTTLAGLVVVLSILVKQISALFVTIKSLFAL